MNLDEKVLDAIKRQYASIWTNIIGEEPPEVFKDTGEKEAE